MNSFSSGAFCPEQASCNLLRKTMAESGCASSNLSSLILTESVRIIFSERMTHFADPAVMFKRTTNKRVKKIRIIRFILTLSCKYSYFKKGQLKTLIHKQNF